MVESSEAWALEVRSRKDCSRSLVVCVSIQGTAYLLCERARTVFPM